LQIAYSVGHYKITAGIIGAFVRPTQGGAAAILSKGRQQQASTIRAIRKIRGSKEF
jgi:hypothetical protein